MTIKELIDRLQQLPADTKVLADNGYGYAYGDVYLYYAPQEGTVGIYAYGKEDKDEDF